MIIMSIIIITAFILIALARKKKSRKFDKKVKSGEVTRSIY